MSIESMMLSNHLILGRPFSSCLPSFPASGSFLVSRLFTSGGQSTGTSTSAWHLPNVNMHIVYRSKLTMLMGGGKRTHGLSLTQISPVAKELKMINNGTHNLFTVAKPQGLESPSLLNVTLQLVVGNIRILDNRQI